MELNFFADCKTKEDVRKTFFKLCIQLHPDKGGDHNAFIRMKREYDYAIVYFKNSADCKETTAENEQCIQEMIENLCKIRGIEIELCGVWLWITGDTYGSKDRLKELGCMFSSKKKAWYWHENADGKKYRGRCSLEDIRNKYGSEKFFGASLNTQVIAA